MSDKVKLSMICDFACSSGFAAVAHQIAKYLKTTDVYDINILGINYHGTPHPMAKEFNVWPANLGGDFLGVGYTRNFILQTKPDVTFLFQDFWNLPLYIGEIPEQLRRGIVAYYPVDSPNVKGEYVVALSAASELACYTQFGVEESVRGAKESYTALKDMAIKQNIDYTDNIRVAVGAGVYAGKDQPGRKNVELDIPVARLKQLLKPENYNVIPHGFDGSVFTKVPQNQARDAFRFGHDWFIVGNVNRNQSRKRQDLSLRAFAEFAKDKPNARLVMHCVRADIKGWDLVQLALYYEIADKVIFTHDFFQGKEATLEQLNILYNTFDAQINTGGGEGWGLTAFEGGGIGIPQVVPNWSATKEIWEGAGKLIDVVSVRHEPYMINTMQAVIDTTHCANILTELYEDKVLREEVGQKCKEVTERPEYKWENIGAQFDELLIGAVGSTPKRSPVAFTAKGVQELKKKGIIV